MLSSANILKNVVYQFDMICSTIFFKKKLANKTCLDDVYQPQSQYNVGHLTVKLHGASKGLHYII